VPASGKHCVAVKAHPERGLTGMDYGIGVAAETTGAERLCLQVVDVPASSRAKAHLHAEHESAAYVISGQIVVWSGERLEHSLVLGPGDFCYIPARLPHLPANYTAEPARAVLARSDPGAQESVVLLPHLDSLPHLGAPPATRV
jgi:uncharacterized RmlC-like cupin family protein